MNPWKRSAADWMNEEPQPWGIDALVAAACVIGFIAALLFGGFK